MVNWNREIRNGLRAWHRSVLWYFQFSKVRAERDFKSFVLTVWLICPTALGVAYFFSKRMY